MTYWKKHRFLSLSEEDDIDNVLAGSQFLVKFIGSTDVGEQILNTEESVEQFYSNLVEEFPAKNSSLILFRFIVDMSGAMLYDQEGGCLQRFQLSDIKDIVHCENSRAYCKYFILVGKEESDSRVKAYVLACEDKQKAKCMYQIFIRTFSLGAEIMRSKAMCPSSTDGVLSPQALPRKFGGIDARSIRRGNTVAQSPSRLFAENVKADRYDEGSRVGRLNLSNNQTYDRVGQGIGSQGNSEDYLDDCFTELARSRSLSSNVSSLTLGSEGLDAFSDSSTSEDNVFW